MFFRMQDSTSLGTNASFVVIIPIIIFTYSSYTVISLKNALALL